MGANCEKCARRSWEDSPPEPHPSPIISYHSEKMHSFMNVSTLQEIEEIQNENSDSSGKHESIVKKALKNTVFKNKDLQVDVLNISGESDVDLTDVFLNSRIEEEKIREMLAVGKNREVPQFHSFKSEVKGTNFEFLEGLKNELKMKLVDILEEGREKTENQKVSLKTSQDDNDGTQKIQSSELKPMSSGEETKKKEETTVKQKFEEILFLKGEESFQRLEHENDDLQILDFESYMKNASSIMHDETRNFFDRDFKDISNLFLKDEGLIKEEKCSELIKNSPRPPNS